ncbi:hypothetical protein LCGC14_1748580 [marine sediment metagenome]|uniref:Uncharacterized protein n=1 Tax=marine sediment metagenome TaxID=412755 RepID=A0A0F9HRY0_9ZZZZ
MKVRAYLKHNVTHEFPARDTNNAREIAKRICGEGLWVVNEDEDEVFYPITEVFKVKIVK